MPALLLYAGLHLCQRSSCSPCAWKCGATGKDGARARRQVLSRLLRGAPPAAPVAVRSPGSKWLLRYVKLESRGGRLCGALQLVSEIGEKPYLGISQMKVRGVKPAPTLTGGGGCHLLAQFRTGLPPLEGRQGRPPLACSPHPACHCTRASGMAYSQRIHHILAKGMHVNSCSKPIKCRSQQR